MTKISFHRGFTLLELLIVIGIMGLLGTVSVSGFRGLKKGMEERGAMQVVDEFVRSAYRRAVIDRVPVSLYFWNETTSDETVGQKLVVVGHAVAVRRGGWVSAKDGDLLIDEFGDLARDTYRDQDGKETTANTSEDPGRFLYKVGKNNTTFARSVVSSMTVRKDRRDYLQTRPNQSPYPEIRAYGYKVLDPGNVTWDVGDAYGFEIAELTLPRNYIFENSYSTSVSTPEKGVKVIAISGNGTINGGSVAVSGLQLDKSGGVSFKSIGSSGDPKRDR